MNILWDMDGTLIDSMPVIVQSMNRTRQAFGLNALSDDALRPFVGPSIHSTFAGFLQTDDSARIDEAVEYYRARYDEALADSPVFEGIEAALDALHQAGCRQFVATAKYHRVAERLLSATGLRPWFVDVYGSEADGTLGHKPDLLRHLLRQEGLNRAETVMVGDTHFDMAAAVELDLNAIGVAWGYGDNDALVEAGAGHLVKSPANLLAAVRESVCWAC